MLQCRPQETLIFVRLFYNFSNSLLLLFIFFHFTFIFLAKLFIFFGGNPFYQGNEDDEYGFDAFSDENEYYGANSAKSMEEENHYEEEDDDQDCSCRDIIWNSSSSPPLIINTSEDSSEESLDDDSEETRYSTPAIDESSDQDEVVEEDIRARRRRTTHDDDSETNENDPTSCQQLQPKMEMMSLRQEDNNFLVYDQPPINPISHSQGKKLLVQEKEEDDPEIFGDTFTIGSTSSEWRNSSINYSGTEDPFSSSSRRSCPNWESYTLFQKYDEEMLYLDRITLQKLQETESLMRSIKSCPRSISERIVHKVMRYSSSSDHQLIRRRHNNPYSELECAYVAQICLTWEALNWNYNYYQRLIKARTKFADPGCPAYVAQQFQQFQVLLQRYIENEPYEHGRRPEIYARIRSFTPKLLQVPEYRDSDDDKIREEGEMISSSRIHSSSFIGIMEESIRTFMKFLKQEKKNKFEILADLFRGRSKSRSSSNRRGSAADDDATLDLLLLLKKVNKKKKSKLNIEVRRSAAAGKCWLNMRKRRNNKLMKEEEEELEMLMALIDLKVVSRVLRMPADYLNGEQLHWCENKMSKVRVSPDGKLHRDSSPLFFPAHNNSCMHAC